MWKIKEKGMQILFMVAASMSILAVAMICLFMFANGIPAIKEIGFFDFIFGKVWSPNQNIYGIDRKSVV